jgi:preprotein translocase subunit Sec63
VINKTSYPRLSMKYNIEKINEIGKMLAEVVEDEIKGEGQAEVLIGNVEMVLRESL